MFCSPFDEALAQGGAAAIFLPDPEGMWRFDASWTRDAWGRDAGPHAHAWRYAALRDKRSGFAFVALVTSPTLLVEHPRLDVRLFESLDEARRFVADFGDPPITEAPWA
ncbi:MAG: hypothetical protein EP330_29385 [Deltaproteobacteria bacterium]|nr:MAG: hypothetical protein EP330_29385 [Deltaproteobacteria bacterium]